MLIKMAWRNIWRHPGRSLTIIGSVTLGIWAILLLTALYEGMIRQRVRDVISIEMSHLQIHHQQFLSDWEPRYIIPSSSVLSDSLRRDLRVQAFSGRQLSSGMLNSSGGSNGVKLIGVDPAEERKVSELEKKILEGNFLSDSTRHQVLIGAKLAERLKLKMKSKVVLMCQSVSGDIASGAFRVGGIYRTNNEPFDETHVYLRREYLEELLGINNGIHEIAVLLSDDGQVEILKAEYADRWKPLEVKSWMDLSPEMKLLIGFFDEYMAVFMLIVFLAVAFGIVNTMLMSVLERSRELGMMFAIGMNKRRVFVMITLETLFLMLAGLPAGILAGISTVWYLGEKGIRFGSSEVMSNFGFGSVLYPALTSGQIITTALFITLITLVSSIYPSVRAIMISPSEAIRK